MKRVVVISDTHCGHEYGLTPPEWWYGIDSGDALVRKTATFQRKLWGFYSDSMKALIKDKAIDVLIVNGDSVDGKGEKSGGTEQFTTDRIEQCRMAAKVIDEAKAAKVRLLYGTRYHTGKDEDFESIIPEMVACTDVSIEGHGFYTVNGVNLDVKHKINSSGVPHGRMTALARAKLWNTIWHSEHARQPKADIIIRSHVHYHNLCGGPGWLAMTCPALTYNTTYGVRECEGIVDVGFLVFDIDDEGGYDWFPVFAEFDELKVQSVAL